MTNQNTLNQTKTILVVDDEKIILKVVNKLLNRKGYDVLTAETGKQAIELFKNNKIDLVILDMIMPEMDGKETFTQLQNIDENVKVIISSGYSLNEKSQALLDAGCVGFIKKPYDIDDLYNKINEVL